MNLPGTTSERWARIQMAQLHADQLRLEARTCTDPDRLEVIGDEMQVIYDSMVELRQEQIMESLPKPPQPKRRWWRRRDP